MTIFRTPRLMVIAAYTSYTNTIILWPETVKGLLLELQLRTRLQHTWATAVETMGTFRGEALKSRQGSKEWLEFFALISSAFAHVEKTPLLPQYASLTAKETFREVARTENNLQVLEHIRGIAVAANAIHTQGAGGFYSELPRTKVRGFFASACWGGLSGSQCIA